ncbi:hypothetical protein GCM10018966_061730 [Streptomyces yanii]
MPGRVTGLLRAANRRSTITAEAGAIMAKEHVREWFDDLVEAEYWRRTLTSCCGDAQLARLREAADALDELVAVMVGSTPRRGGTPGLDNLHTAIRIVAELARADGQLLATQR